ncbi:MAG TPA: hypothetical protein VFW29_03485 [Solirubrobacteraceae bacterium]|nr:hypothetical protein [Solirubrobacteraceae bacterium]
MMVTTDEGEMIWNEGVKASDFEGEHFRRALVDRVGWAAADAESAWHLTTAKPVRIDQPRHPREEQVAATPGVLAA